MFESTKTNKYFRLSDNTLMSRGWTYADSSYPKSELTGLNCDKCGARGIHASKEFDVDLERGTKFPDILMNGGWPYIIVSEKVVTDWENAGVTGFDYYSVGINKIKAKKLKDKIPPKYFHIVVTGRCELDLEEMGVSIKEKCSKCGNVTFNKDVWEINKFVIKESTWSGNDLFISDLFEAIVLCTEKVIINACKNKHTNFEFRRAEESLIIIPPFPEPIDYLRYCKKSK